MRFKKLWIGFGLVVGISFLVLGYYGYEIYQKAPPIPEKVKTENGKLLFSERDIKDGQAVWRSIGGHELGTVWGHGAYTAPDWSADHLHRTANFMLDRMSEERYGKPYQELAKEEKAKMRSLLQQSIRANRYDPETGVLTVSKLRAKAQDSVAAHYRGLFTDKKGLQHLREAYAIPKNTIEDSSRISKLNAFFFWTSWACVTERPNAEITYTHNWPPDKLVGNEPTSSLILWTGFSVILLLAGIGALSFYYASHREEDPDPGELPSKDPLFGLEPTPSMKATYKYFAIVTFLILLQVIMGVITAHYGVEGTRFYGFPLAEWLPYSISRTWHVQLAIFWIATSWLATGLFIAPTVSGFEPKYQRFGVNVLFGALLVVVLGSMAGQWMGVMQELGLIQNFWFGHQGYEYVDLGRFWQILLLIGLVLWLYLVGRAIIPAIKKQEHGRHLLVMFLIASIAIALFYGAGLMWGRDTNLAIMEYWRWWVVHLWVEGFFEVFATVVIAFIFTKLRLLGTLIATSTVIFSTIIFLTGGILGTFHHLYFTGTPTPVLAIGATFSALEVVPLVLIGFEAWHHLKLAHAKYWIQTYKWPIYCFVAVAFWNLVGAGIFGFLINPPIALYYMQGLNTTPVHAHTALFGVYGMLGIGLMLFVLKGINTKAQWKEKPLKFAFWSINIGLMAMVLLSVLPVGLAQTWVSVKEGIWYARSAEFMDLPIMNTFKWLRVVGDTIFAVGILVLVWFVIGVKTGWSVEKELEKPPEG